MIDFLLNVFQIFIICMKRNWVCACRWPRLVGGWQHFLLFFFFSLRFCDVGSSNFDVWLLALLGLLCYVLFSCHVFYGGEKYPPPPPKKKSVSWLQIHFKKCLVFWGCLSCLQIHLDFIFSVEKKSIRDEIALVGCFENRYCL